MRVSYSVRLLLVAALVCLFSPDRPGARGAEEQPVTTLTDAVGKQLTKWFAEGTAAGNASDWYDNRDGGHSNLRTAPWPQLRRVEYTPEEIKARRNWAAMYLVRPGGKVMFGNSSTSATPEASGSNIRTLYSNARGLGVLYQQYTHNHLYIYPEHRDHDPGDDGDGGYGDLYPTNTPYLIASQGSSGSDQPFMRAMPSVLAAFRPEVKKRLISSELLMPTVQMIFRKTGKQLDRPEDYITGLAHPTVMEGKNVDPLAMIELAHAITSETIPPMVKLKLLERSPAERGVDYYDAAESELLAETPGVIALVHRSRDRERRLVVSVADSLDVNDRPLEFTWSLLRGDPERVKIRPLDRKGTQCEILVRWQERRPISPGSEMQSNRVDIGVFAYNGAYWSAPAFVTVYSLDNECRTYDDNGRVLEIGYGAGRPRLSVRDWPGLLELAAGDSPAAKLLPLTETDRRRLAGAAEKYRQLDAAKQAAQTKRTAADAARRTAAEKDAKQAEAASREAATKFTAAQKELTDFTQLSPGEGQVSLDELFRKTLGQMCNDPQFIIAHAEAINALLKQAGPAQQASLASAGRKLTAGGLLAGEKPPAEGFDTVPRTPGKQAANPPAGPTKLPLKLTPLRPGDGPVADRLTDYERRLLAAWQAELIARVLLPELVTVSNRTPLVDRRISIPKHWRDVYHWDKQGQLLGWTRYEDAGPTEFNHDGQQVVERDPAGRCIVGQQVDYRLDMPAGRGGRAFFSAGTQVRWQTLPVLGYYEFSGADDRFGKITRRKALPGEQPQEEQK